VAIVTLYTHHVTLWDFVVPFVLHGGLE